MRRMLVALVLLILALPVRAQMAPRVLRPADPPRDLRSESAQFATLLLSVTQHVEGLYFRPVSQAALVEAAITGLYEIVREPLPAGLRSDLAAAKEHADFHLILTSARERLGSREALQGQKGLLLAVQSLNRVLDPYCGIPSNNDRRSITYSDGYYGVGLELEPDPNALPVQYLPQFDEAPARPTASGRRGPVRIVDVMPGGPAQRAGIRPHDLITHIDGRELRGNEVPALIQRLTTANGAGPGTVRLTLQRAGRTQPMDIELIPIQFAPESVFGHQRRDDNSWNFLLDAKNRIGYVRVGFIDGTTPDEMRTALNELLAVGARGLILDLRWCPGGYVDPAVELAGLFVKNGEVATVRAKQRGEPGERRHRTGDTAVFTGIPIITLTGGETMGGGEMLAAALQDHKIALVAGQRTFGKGSVQTSDTLQALGMTYKVTTGLFFRPSGKNLHRFPESQPGDVWGVRPDVGLELPVSNDLNRQIKEWMREQTLRPGSSRQVLPLDDAGNDPLRQFAQRELLKKLK